MLVVVLRGRVVVVAVVDVGGGRVVVVARSVVVVRGGVVVVAVVDVGGGCVVVVTRSVVEVGGPVVVLVVVDVVPPGQMKMRPLSCSTVASAASPSATCAVRSRQGGHMPPPVTARALRT